MVNREGLVGTRIRERRTIAGLKQADLARHVGISASYLNLIEHNKRRIGGKLLLDIAAVLKVEPQTILEGAEAALIASLREAAEGAGLAAVEAGKAEEFAGRFPGWADALADAFRRNTALERLVETLSDRVAHDPQLAASLHAVLTAAASIRATASILDETDDIDDAVRRRFHANVHEDSRRLSESAKFLVEFLEADPEGAGTGTTAQEDAEAWMARHGYVFPSLENGEVQPEEMIAAASELTEAAKDIARRFLERYARDARRLPHAEVQDALLSLGYDPAGLAARCDVPVSMILRRLASLSEYPAGLIVADRAGSLVFRKPIEGFTSPRFGSACALWPLFHALTQPGVLIREHVAQLGQVGAVFEVFAIAEAVTPPGYNAPPIYQATMLLRPFAPTADVDVRDTGVTCRVCPKAGCVGRREPSILSDAI